MAGSASSVSAAATCSGLGSVSYSVPAWIATTTTSAPATLARCASAMRRVEQGHHPGFVGGAGVQSVGHRDQADPGVRGGDDGRHVGVGRCRGRPDLLDERRCSSTSPVTTMDMHRTPGQGAAPTDCGGAPAGIVESAGSAGIGCADPPGGAWPGAAWPATASMNAATSAVAAHGRSAGASRGQRVAILGAFLASDSEEDDLISGTRPPWWTEECPLSVRERHNSARVLLIGAIRRPGPRADPLVMRVVGGHVPP
jgi:hypothetical protein